MFAIYEEDIIIAFSDENIFGNCIELPEQFINYELDQLRITQNGEIIDITDYTEFYVCDIGEKHIYNNSEQTRQLIQCKWDDILERDEYGNWQVITLERLKRIKMEQVYKLRKQKENLGIYVDDFFVDTSQNGRFNLTSTLNAYDWGLLLSDTTVDWKLANGNFQQVNYNQLKIFAGYVAQYIESLFQCEKNHDDYIKNLQCIDDINDYDINQKWPVNKFSIK